MGTVLEKISEILEKAESKRESIKNAMLLLQGEWGQLANDLGSSQKLLQHGFSEFEARTRDLNSLKKSVTESIKELDLYRKSLEERFEVVVEREIELHAKTNLWVEEMEKKRAELEKEGAELNEFRENYVEEAGYREEKLTEQANLVKEIFKKIELERKEIEKIKESVEEKFKGIELKEKYIDCQKRIFMRRENEQNDRERELKERENQLILKAKNLEEREREVELKEKELGSMKEELEIKEKELGSMKEELEFKEKEADLIRELSEKRNKELDSRERELDSMKKYTQSCFKKYRSKKKECQLEKELTEKELKSLVLKRDELEEKIEQIELREKELELKEKQYNDALNTRINADGVVAMDGKALQILLNESTKDMVTVSNEVFEALHLSLNPAKLVLDAMEGFYPPHLRKGDNEFEVSVVRRSCIIILEQLAELSPIIEPCERNGAMELASKWKVKMSIDDSLEVLGFLQLLASYDLCSAFNVNEIMSLLEGVAHLQQTTELCRLLGFADRTIGLIQNLLKNSQYLDAVRFICAFDHVDHFPPVPILKEYLARVENTANALLKEENNSRKAQEEATDQKVAAMRAVIGCIKDYNLESEYSSKLLEKCIDQLMAKKAIKKFSASTSRHEPKKQQKVKVKKIPSGNALVPYDAQSSARNSSESRLDPPHPFAIILANMDGRDLLFFLKDHIYEVELFDHCISSALQISNDSAELVLTAIKSLYDSLQKEESKDETGDKWRSCIVLLQQLIMLSPQTKAETKEEARKLAVDLQEIIQAEPDNPLAIFVFLLFIGTYGVTSSFCTDDLLRSFESRSEDQLVLWLCHQALRISEGMSEKSRPESLDEILQYALEILVFNNRKASKLVLCEDCVVQDLRANKDKSMADEDPFFICEAIDPAKFLLDAAQGCYNSNSEIFKSPNVVSKSFFRLLELLMIVAPEIKPDVEDKAKKFALDWKADWTYDLSARTPSCSERKGFLRFITIYRLSPYFHADELLFLLEAVHQPEKEIFLLRKLGLVQRIPKLVSNLIQKKKLLVALAYIYLFKLVHKFPPVYLLKDHIDQSKQPADKSSHKMQKTKKARDKALVRQISALQDVIKCIEKYGLESEYPSDGLWEQIEHLQCKRENLKKSKRSCSFTAQKKQMGAQEREAAPSPKAQLRKGTKKRSSQGAGIGNGALLWKNKRPRSFTA